MENNARNIADSVNLSPDNFSHRENSEKLLSNLKKIKTQTSTVKQRANSDMNSGAQIATLCEARQNENLNINLGSIIPRENKNLADYEKAVLELMFLYGLRISEVLQVNFSNINSLGSITIFGLKGSENRLVYPVIYKDFWLSLRNNKIHIPSSFNRFYFYRLFKKLGIYNLFVSHKNSSVTHILRYNFINTLLKNEENIETIQQILGHKSINSTIHYVTNLQQKKRS